MVDCFDRRGRTPWAPYETFAVNLALVVVEVVKYQYCTAASITFDRKIPFSNYGLHGLILNRLFGMVAD